jgi:hypothetical protein
VTARLRSGKVGAGHPHGLAPAFCWVHGAAPRNPPRGLPTVASGLRAAVVTSAVVNSTVNGAWVEVSG